MDDNKPKSNTFTDEGRLPQVEFAIKNVSRAGTIIGYVCSDGVVLMGVNKEPTNGPMEKIYQLSDSIYCVLCGLFGDAMELKRYARIKAQEVLERFGVECPLTTLCKFVGQRKQAFTQYAGTRPFGVSFLYAGVIDGKYALMSTDPSGTSNRWKGMCYGENEEAINRGLKNDFPEDEMDMKTATVEILRLLGKARELGPKEADRLEILHFSKDCKKYLPCDEVLKLLEEIHAK
ncbi:26S PROTEASOME ALPHA-TYPE SUBUNIT C9 [Encephalitozoon cuniculi GB-M1]|uniref:Probable proteasome subunit alpha type-3 n=2 Tax=Encephalitozoon cuniculi TaxID=6035 RepID=PSA3_ENCCU|nr:proteasome regulatory particle lid subunit RPN3 [Encephalitozoon cuniculi GB-M1]Q8SRU7.1 RecName: Full=Probable proteasome subunit alpha type-3; AltName: Full=26S proteasome alpha-type subunit PRE9; AltName: Full=Multicatalytic endopeptidase complex subunit PRE9 [Encephalitozoon cuniculi GB-M1]AGE95448.1 26S proteasome alpha-type subunit C9 [Encephalitozoon cuniculi]KMV66191.1 proteasome alpha subunit [Encephalitozoon cuniculi EcunIII-L]UYI27931.1 proteasome subunit [Encephalitozoon cuniculi